MQTTFDKEIEDNGTKYPPPIFFNFYTHAEINDSDYNNSLHTSYQTILSRIEK